jgi:outer membrane protein
VLSIKRREQLNKFLQFVLAASLAMMAVTASAEIKVGYVEVERIMKESPQMVESSKKLEKEFSSRSAELQRMAKQINDQEASMNNDTSTMSEGDRRNKEQNLSTLKIDFQRKQRELNEDVNLRKNEELSGLQDRINKAITSISETEGYDLVIYSGAAYVGKRVDITDKVLKALGK